ncbi:MAG: prepilin-type N-terminal cleavage/methylation domain-containing protein [Phycisphaeraceae bacterium JB051]
MTITRSTSRQTQHSMRPSAFTLIELLVVISIISLLISILLPALGAARKSARAAQCISYQKSIGTVFYVYANDNKEYTPAIYSPIWYIGSDGWLFQYGGSDMLKMDCPDYRLMYGTGDGYGNYGLSQHVAAAPPWGFPHRRMSSFLKSNLTLIMTDVKYTGTNVYSSAQFAIGDYMSPIGGWSSTDTIDYRHLGACNMLFVDGHAGAIKDPIAYNSWAWNKQP